MKNSSIYGDRLLDAVGFIGDDIVAEAASACPTAATIPGKRHRRFKMNVKIVAALLVIVLMGVMWPVAQYIYEQYSASHVITPPDDSTEEHVWTDVETLREPTCTVPGEKLVKCQICGDEEIREIPVLGHTPDEWVIDYEASIGKDGQKHATCTVCGEYFTEIIYALGSPGLHYKRNPDGVSYNCYIGTCNNENIIVAKGYNDLPVTTVSLYQPLKDTQVKSIYIPSTVTEFSDLFGKNLSELISITIEDGNPLFYVTDDCLINKETGELVLLLNGAAIPTDGSATALCASTFNLSDKKVEALTIPDCITKIGDNTFASFKQLKTIDLHDGITEIGANAFEDCKSLIEISIPEGVKVIDFRTFYKCNSLKTVTIPSSVTKIGLNVFGYCKSLEEIVIPDSVTEIGAWAFLHCTNLERVECSNSVTALPFGIFNGCTSLKSFEGAEGLEVIGQEAFKNCASLSSITINEGVTTISSFAFSNCASLTQIKLPGTLTSIGEFAFENCDMITAIDIPDSVTSIGRYAFSLCTSLQSISLGKQITTLDEGVFSDCTSLTSFEISERIEKVHPTALMGCNNLTDLTVSQKHDVYRISGGCLIDIKNKALVFALPEFTIPADGSVEVICNSAFRKRTDLSEIVIPEGIKSIGDGAFNSCRNLRTVTLPDSIEAIGNGAFAKCAIKSISFGSSLKVIGDSAFKSCESLISVVLPEGVETVDTCAFQLCTKLSELYLPPSIKTIGARFVEECDNLQTVNYGGSSAEWAAMAKEDDPYEDDPYLKEWCAGIVGLKIKCIDTTITLEQ